MTTIVPPWIAMTQAHADQAQARLDARDIVNGVIDDVIGARPQTHRRDPLNPATVAYLAERGITRREWITEHGHLAEWTGDTCGCPDDRCAGHHHDQDADCMCVAVLASEYLDETR